MKALSLLLLLAGNAQAFPNFAVLYKSTYSYLPSCMACHEQDSWDANAFGKQFMKNGRNLKAFQAIADLDADGDGIANYLEIKAKSNPGDPHSTPKRPGDWLNEAGLRPPKKLLAAAFPGASAYKVREFALDAKQDAALAKSWGEALPDESRFSAVFEAVDKDKKSGAGTYLSVDLPGAKGPSLLFVGSAKPGVLSFLKVIEYDGTKALSKEKTWSGLVGKTKDAIFRDSSVNGPMKEIDAFKRAIVRGLLVLEATWVN